MDHACYCVVLRKMSRRLTSLYDEALEPFGINISQFSQLRNIRFRAPVSVTELASILDLDRSTVGRNTKVLQRMGLVDAVPGEDQRESVLVLTDRAIELLAETTPVWRAVQQRVEKSVDSALLDKMMDDLKAI